jgi:hypothetical protein
MTVSSIAVIASHTSNQNASVIYRIVETGNRFASYLPAVAASALPIAAMFGLVPGLRENRTNRFAL